MKYVHHASAGTIFHLLCSTHSASPRYLYSSGHVIQRELMTRMTFIPKHLLTSAWPLPAGLNAVHLHLQNPSGPLFLGIAAWRYRGVVGPTEEPVKDIPVKQERRGVTYSHCGSFSILKSTQVCFTCVRTECLFRWNRIQCCPVAIVLFFLLI